MNNNNEEKLVNKQQVSMALQDFGIKDKKIIKEFLEVLFQEEDNDDNKKMKEVFGI